MYYFYPCICFKVDVLELKFDQTEKVTFFDGCSYLLLWSIEGMYIIRNCHHTNPELQPIASNYKIITRVYVSNINLAVYVNVNAL